MSDREVNTQDTFTSRYIDQWPALYFIDADGMIHDSRFGEGRYVQSEAIGRENVTLGRTGGSIAYRFHARDAHLVLASGANGPIPFQRRLDGEVPGPAHGADIDEDGNGLLCDGRLYQLVRQHDTIRERTVQIRFLAPGAQAYAFTFG